MADQEIPPLHTPITAEHLYAVLRCEWRLGVRTEPSRASLLLLLAQWSLETGGGAAAICWNLAGIKYAPGCGQNYTCYATQEVIGGVRRTIRPPDPGCRFRAYASIEDATQDYLLLLRTRFAFAWRAVLAGDVKDFAHRLKQADYYTAPEAEYAAGLESRYAALDHDVGDDTQPQTPISRGRVQPSPGDDEDTQSTPPGGLPPPDSVA